MPNQEHVEVVKAGADAVRLWRASAHPDDVLDLSGADLSGLSLLGIDFEDADLSAADLRGTNLVHGRFVSAHLEGANFAGADLYSADFLLAKAATANFEGAKMGNSAFDGTDLDHSNFTGADLGASKFVFAELDGADLFDAELVYCSFIGTSLAGIQNLDKVRPTGAVMFDITTLEKSLDDSGQFPGRVRAFLLSGGVPERIVDSMPTLFGQIRYSSCFISYGEPNVNMAKRIRGDLAALGVSCWLYDLDATPGRRTWEEIGARRTEADKFVILASAEALIREGVLKEIEEQIDENPEKIIVVSLDRLWSQPGFQVRRGTRDLKPFLMDRNWVDMTDDYQSGLQKLLKGLERSG